MVKSLVSLSLILIFSFFSGATHASTLQVEELAAISPDSIGVLDERGGGLPNDVWANTPYNIMISLFDKLPEPASPASTRMAFKLLASTTAPPPSYKKDGQLLNIRMLKLLKLQRYDVVENMMAYIPAPSKSDQIEQIYVLALLKQNKVKQGCQRIDGNISRFNTNFWQRLMILCHITSGNYDQADLTVALMTEDGYQFSDSLHNVLNTRPEKIMVGDILNGLVKLEYLNDSTASAEKKFLTNQKASALLEALLLSEDKQWNRDIPYQWRNTHNRWTPDLYKKLTTKFYTILEQFGYAVPIDEWRLLVVNDPDKTEIDFPLLRQLRYAASNQLVGETLLLTLTIMDGKHPSEISDVIFSEILHALNSIGQHDSAYFLAMESLQKAEQI